MHLLILIYLYLNYIYLLFFHRYLLSDELKTDISIEDKQLAIAWKSGAAYAKCNNEFPLGFGEKTWDSKLEDIVVELTNHNMFYHTAPVIWDMIGEESNNTKVVTDLQQIIQRTLILIHHIFISDTGVL